MLFVFLYFLYNMTCVQIIFRIMSELRKRPIVLNILIISLCQLYYQFINLVCVLQILE